MSRIAGDCVSYEHIAPLQYDGIDAIREVCRNGFDAMKGELQVDLPGLKVIVRDDIAVTWGLNHMQAQEPGKERFEVLVARNEGDAEDRWQVEDDPPAPLVPARSPDGPGED